MLRGMGKSLTVVSDAEVFKTRNRVGRVRVYLVKQHEVMDKLANQSVEVKSISTRNVRM